ncbi:hypothetical protein F0562_012433 [Nyssa sinensis]|uniref:DYW domain-containing protein n=1 Tax=Nyssa sinensis TaxID=561372 RepID=A0A5J4ZTR5_9ASTE|nr:hypothetical protein F0562_012433 [Nyssa sinensis]
MEGTNGQYSKMATVITTVYSSPPTVKTTRNSISISDQTTHCISLLKSCSNIRDFLPIHAHLITTNLISDPLISKHILRFFISIGDFDHVRPILSRTGVPETITWNTLMENQLQEGSVKDVFLTYHQMVTEGVPLDVSTFHFLIHACCRTLSIGQGNEIHGRILKSGLGISRSLKNNLMGLYSKAGRLEEVRKLFEKYPDRDVISWNTMISCYVRMGLLQEALDLFRKMMVDGVVPDDITMVSLISACTKLRDLQMGENLHAYVEQNGLEVNGSLFNCLVDMYIKCGEMERAHELLDRIKCEIDVVLWTTLISGYVKAGDLVAARRLFNQMTERNLILWTTMISGYVQDEAVAIFEQLPSKSIVSWNTLLDGYCRSGDTEKARTFFDKIPEKDVVSWNTMINCYTRCHQFGALFELFRELQISNVKPNNLTLISLLSACASAGALNHGIWVHVYIKKNHIKLDNMLGTALIDMYGKCGSIDKAYESFSEVTEKNVFLWTTMIGAHAMEGQAWKAIELYTEMEEMGIKPDHITFIALLSACSHGGLVDEGYKYFTKMSSFYNIGPKIQHYGCMVDLLGRAGCLEEAVKFIETMPIKPDASIWSALMRACSIHHDIQLAEHAFKHLTEMEPLNDAAYVLLSNIYAKAGRWENVSWVRRKLKELGVQKQLGCSLIEQNGVVHEFISGDFSDPQAREIYLMLDEMEERISKEELQEASSSPHSEKLAVAYGLISSPGNTTIRVVNNLRICNNCHSAMKIISQAYDREIVIRDNYRFHRFSDGSCSCKDQW